MTDTKEDAYHNTNVAQTAEDRVTAMWKALTDDANYEGWDSDVLRGVRLISATEGHCEFEAVVTERMCNKGKNMHGGCASTMLDNLSSTTLLTIARTGFLDRGTVSRTLSLTFLRPVPVGSKIRIICNAVAGGRTLAHCTAEIQTMDGKVCITCVHDKAVVQPKTKSKI